MRDRHPLVALRRLLSTDEPTRGIVANRYGDQLTVATARGVIVATAADAVLRAGDEVNLHRGVARRRAVARLSYPL